MRKFTQPWIFVMGFLLLCLTTLAQEKTITGTVTDENNAPLAGASVNVKGTNRGTLTDAAGHFSIQAASGQALIVSFIGYTPQEFEVGKTASLAIKLKQGQNNLQDVVVVGYGTQRRANLTGAVTTVNVKEQLGSRPTNDVARGLQGSVPGLTITTPSGDIGTNPSITLRGLSGSLNGGGAKPLILVDNVEFTDLRMINPDDIESISVLKDAASTSIYGTRAAWGVVLITTKSGRKGAERTQISYNNNFSFSQPTTIPKVAPGAEGAEMALLAYKRNNPNTTTFSALGMTVDQIAIQKMRDWQAQYGNQNLGDEMVMGRDFEIRNNQLFFYRTWDPMEMYLRNWAPQQNHNLSIDGSSAKVGYTLGLGYTDQKGALKVNPDEFQRFTANLGVNASVTSWLDARSKIILSRAKRTRPYYFSSDTYDPWYYLSRWQAYYPYGTYEGKPFRSALTEVQQAKMTPYYDNLTRVQLGGTFKIMKGLTFDGDYTFTSTGYREQQTGGSVAAWDFWGGQMIYRPYTSATYDRAILASAWSERNTVRGFATYNADLGKAHSLKFITGTDIEVFENGYQRAERRTLLNPDMGQPNLATGDQFVGSSARQWATRGYFGRINYAFQNKYLLELNGRYDGSSSFPVKDQWAFFPSVSAGYVLTQENFMDFSKNILNFLKLRGSWGSVGNQDVGSNRFLSIMNSTTSGWLVGNVNMATVGTPPLVSPSLTWETVTTLDFGVDAKLFNNKLGVTFDWYNRTTSDMITGGLTVPSTLGTSAPPRNFGDLQTKGWELQLDWSHRFGKDFQLNITGLLSDFQEKLTKYGSNATGLISSNYEGRLIGEIWGYETDRFFTADDFQKDANGNLLLQNGKYVMNKGVATQTRWETGTFFYGPGDIKYKDLNGDGKIDIGSNTVSDPGDQRIIGNSTPRYQYGVRLGVDWKGIDLNMFVQGVGSRQMWANGPVVIPGYRIGEGWFAHQLDYWKPENPNAYYPRPTDQLQSNATRNFLPQTKYLLNMAYTRLKNVNIGYKLPVKWASRAGLKNVRLYVSGENLLTFDRLQVPIDPEVNYTDAGLNDPNTFGRVYPYRKSISFGVQVNL
ncbi:SusC/RagA family TonB-linked outer membrane protein [Flavisolibacter nicotianae]|uniref:SusC/RagA family TonB-linked outer membrane protein n=1 Tax=Flavisolibacter nicotianae TaxID=2364882 RepID=UPI000EB57B66|nr:TonB-dependent receptor [Flavisolibacter nicotianae]